MRLSLGLMALVVACGGKIDGDDGGSGGVDAANGNDGSTVNDAQGGKDVVTPPTSTCTKQTGTVGVGSNGSCTTTATWSCGDTKYDVSCSCPSTQCTCSEQSGSTGSGTIIKAPSVCPSCSPSPAELAALCGFPTK